MKPPIYDPNRDRLPTLRYRRWQATIRPLSHGQNFVLFAWEAIWLATVVIVAMQLYR